MKTILNSLRGSDHRVNRRDFLRTAAVTSAGAAVLLYGRPGALAASSGAVTIDMLDIQQPNQAWAKVLSTITQQYAMTHPGTQFVNNYVPHTSLNQKVQLLAAQKALPVLYNEDGTDLIAQLAQAGEVLDLEVALQKLGALDAIVPAARSVVKQFNQGKFVALPFELNMEGFWYNKQIFHANGLQPPKTWDDLVAIAAKLQQKGIQPFAASGLQGWPLSRWVGNYLFRKYGPSAMVNVASGKIKLTDPGYVEAAQAVADLGAKGYFGAGVATLDYSPAETLFLTGKAAIYYMGSWAVADFINPTLNKIGASNIGFFQFPNVKGGTGNANQTPMNAGTSTIVNKQKYTPAVGQWLAYMARHYGDTALSSLGTISGFTLRQKHPNLAPLTQLVISQIDATKQPVTIFEVLFSAKALTLAGQDAVSLVTGSMSASNYMTTLQKAL